jgi:hypothetical protein
MRTLLVAALMSVAVAAAYAQDAGSGSGGKGHHKGATDQKADTSKPKADEKAYKAALDRIPDAPKQDPWHSVRP